MSLTTINGGHVPIELWAKKDEVEPQALEQLNNIAKLPWLFHHVAVMPDVHLGKGATVGSVIAMKGAVSPATVGVDIGCGMGAIRTNLRASDLPDDLGAVRAAIEATIPVGFNSHENIAAFCQKGIWDEYTVRLMSGFQCLVVTVRWTTPRTPPSTPPSTTFGSTLMPLTPNSK
jgi:tRNA-splicing ligase RtcB (3'-phosphate/5'-hydroxy nucleic acid ligase)